jgi:hypothetical protein
MQSSCICGCGGYMTRRMRSPLQASSMACSSRQGSFLSVGPVYERTGGRVAVAGALAVVEGVVVPRPFWELVQWLSTRCEWLRGTFALATRPSWRGLVRAERGAPVVRFRGTWRAAPRLTLVVAGKHVDLRTLANAVASCLVAEGTPLDESPFPAWVAADSCGPALDGDSMAVPEAP